MNYIQKKHILYLYYILKNSSQPATASKVGHVVALLPFTLLSQFDFRPGHENFRKNPLHTINNTTCIIHVSLTLQGL